MKKNNSNRSKRKNSPYGRRKDVKIDWYEYNERRKIGVVIADNDPVPIYFMFYSPWVTKLGEMGFGTQPCCS